MRMKGSEVEKMEGSEVEKMEKEGWCVIDKHTRD